MSLPSLTQSLRNLPIDEHGRRITVHFGGAEVVNRRISVPEDVRRTTKLFICFSNRCGSNYLAELLASTTEFNQAGEHFNYETVIAESRHYGAHSLDEYIIKLIQRISVKQNFVVKIAFKQLQFLDRTGILSHIFGDAKFLLLERSDKLAQAISFHIAAQTRQWTSYMSSDVQEDGIRFDREIVGGILRAIIEQYRNFDLFFSVKGIVPALMSYENLVAQPIESTQIALQQLGYSPLKFATEKIRMKQQRTDVNEEFRRLYLKGLAEERTQ